MTSLSDQIPQTIVPCPVQVDDDGKAYIPLPGLPDFRLTPWKADDADDILRLFNYPEIGKWSCRRPYPYAESDLSFMYAPLADRDALLNLLVSALPDPLPLETFDGTRFFLFGALRQVSTGRVVGDMHVGPSDRTESQSEEGGVQNWEMAYNVVPDQAGKGLGSTMINVTLDYLRWLGVNKVVAFCETVNLASGGVLRKTGFTQVKVVDIAWPEEKGGGTKPCFMYEQVL
ncbi:hypothetical protein IAR55_006668 [Kwoniella newhampshirensis]|uniref:N-acetyltransferase domain-containing protein n=1 Tax=Kwoniella newhampshirensis TaxID=1651941 RepID=A0AAW0YUL0_9TREE